MVDGADRGEVRSETGKETLLLSEMVAVELLRDSGETTRQHFEVGGVVKWPMKTQKSSKMARPPHNSGLQEYVSDTNCGTGAVA